MANTLTNLIPVMYEGLDMVARERVGAIHAVTRDTSLVKVAKGQSLVIPIAPAATAYDITPGVTAPNDGDQVFANTTLTIDKSKYVPIRWNGEEMRGLNNGGPGYRRLLADQFAQSIRTLTNLVETDIVDSARKHASRAAASTPGTAPFGTSGDMSDAALLAQILDDNGAPESDRHLILGSKAVANLRGKQTMLLQLNTSGDRSLLRRGSLGEPIMGFELHNSAAVVNHTKGTGATVNTDATGYAIGATSIILKSTGGTGTIKEGDVITFAGDTNRYVVTGGDTDISNGGTITIGKPGLRVAIAAAETVITIINSFQPTVALVKSAMALATRRPASPEGGDMADDVITIVDPLSGIGFEVSLYRQYRQIKYEVALAWGVGPVKEDFIAVYPG